jgi:hypothetical protein
MSGPVRIQEQNRTVRRVERTAGRAALTASSASRIRASACCSACYGRRRRRARIAATAHHGRLLGRPAALSACRACAARRTSRGTLCCDRMARRQPRPSVGALRVMQRRSRGRAQIAAAAHHGRLLGRSAGLSVSTARVASIAPRVVAVRLHGPPSAPADRRSPQHARRRSRAARGSTPPLTTATSRGASGLYRHLRRAAWRIQRAAARRAATACASRATSRDRRLASGSAPRRPQRRLSDRPGA